MKALTLTEPWATLMMLQEKRVETRSWQLPHLYRGQQVAIHAAMGFPKWAADCCNKEPFRACLLGNPAESKLNRGKILCIVRFIGCRRTEDVRGQLDAKELAFGDYSDRRFAWFTEFVKVLPVPVSAKGHLGFWEWHTGPVSERVR